MNNWNAFVQWLKVRLEKPLPGYEAQKKMMNINRPDIAHAPETARLSGILVLLYPVMDDIKIVVIERSADGGTHSGQMAFPGGKKEDMDADIIATALREAQEEINLDISQVEVLGRLSSLYIPISNFEVNPVVAICNEAPILMASDAEVANILRLSVPDIFSKKEIVEVQASGMKLTIRTIAYMLQDGKFIWGATAMVLSELEALLQESGMV